VTLDNFRATKVQFATLKDRELEYKAFLQAKLPGKSRVIALDRLEAAMAASESANFGIQSLTLHNEPPRILCSSKLAVLLLIDGPPIFRDIGGTHLELLLNCKSTVILDVKDSKHT